jgi:CubicO group peptidase (beta-lactamase class C family)
MSAGRVFLLVLLALPAHAEPSLPPEQVATLDAAIRTLLAQRPSAGLSVGVRLGDAQWLTAYGYARLSPAKPATPRTSYRLASVTKTLTGVAIMQLVEQGKVGLDEEIHTYLPKFPRKKWPITVRELLSHLGGIYHYRDNKKEGHFKTHFTTAQALAVFEQWPLAHEPGTKFLYTTYGYDVLGAIIEAASGQSYGEYLKDHLFVPAGMTRSGMEDKKALDADSAVGYRIKAGHLVPSEEIDISSRFAGGGTRSTVEDLLRYARALFAGALLKPATWEQVQLSAQTHDGHWVDYGLGFGVFPQHGHLVVSHLGSQPETTTLLLLLPHQGLAIALATNVENQNELLSDVAAAVVETLLEDGVRRRPLYADDPTEQLLLEGMGRLFSYGLARGEGWGGAVVGAADSDAFARAGELLSREHIAADPEGARKAIAEAHHLANGAVLPRVGAAMAQVLAEEHPEKRYAALGPIVFFSDYAEACAQKACPGPLSPELVSELKWLRTQWDWAGARLGGYRPERAADAKELTDALEPWLSRAAVHPDFTAELAAVAHRWRAAGREADADAALELSARLHPFAVEPQLELADAALLLGDEERAATLYAAASPENLLKRASALELSAHPRAAIAAAWLRKLAGEPAAQK